jgi:hypothetical protein
MVPYSVLSVCRERDLLELGGMADGGWCMKFYSSTALDLLVFTNTPTVIDGILVLLVLPDQNLILSLDWLQYSFPPQASCCWS